MGYTPLSACQSRRYKLLCTCSDEGLVVLICVKITKANKETNPPGETATLGFMWGCAEPPAGSDCLFVSRSNSKPRLTVQSAQSSTTAFTVQKRTQLLRGQLKPGPHTDGSGRRK